MELKTVFYATIVRHRSSDAGYKLALVLNDPAYFVNICPYSSFVGTLKKGLTIKKINTDHLDDIQDHVAKWSPRPNSSGISISLPFSFIGDPITEAKQKIEVPATFSDGSFKLDPVDLTKLTKRTPRAAPTQSKSNRRIKPQTALIHTDPMLAFKESVALVNKLSVELGATIKIEEGVLKATIQI